MYAYNMYICLSYAHMCSHVHHMHTRMQTAQLHTHTHTHSLPLPWGWWFANKLVFKNVREALGFSNCRIFMSGAAPINKEVVEFFICLDIPMLEVYGMSESSGPHTINMFSPGGWKLGSAGRVIEGCELKIASPDSNGDER